MMQPERRDSLPEGPGRWAYEVKLDGFRALLSCTNEKMTLTSRRGKDLSLQFPEILTFLSDIRDQLSPFIPFEMDGEVAFLKTPWSSDFSVCQKRGRMRSRASIEEHISQAGAVFAAFDLLSLEGKSIKKEPYKSRKEKLTGVFSQLNLPVEPDPFHSSPVQLIPPSHDGDALWSRVVTAGGEGVIAKEVNSLWKEGRTDQWIKVKNYRSVNVLVTDRQPNGYYTAAVTNGDAMIRAGSFLHGLATEEKEALTEIFRRNGRKDRKGTVLPDPLPVSLSVIGFEKNELREPRFSSFHLSGDRGPDLYTLKQLHYDLNPLPDHISFSNLDKMMYPEEGLTKRDCLLFLQKTGPALLSWIYDRPLTVIRYPDGIHGKSFYQKNAPDHTPSFVKTVNWEGQNAVVADSLSTLLWLGNQAGLELHVPPENTSGEICELFLDLDPPDRANFDLAREAALDLNDLCTRFSLKTFVKTSGRKGLQVYIPVTPGQLNYSECRLFLSFCARYLEEKKPGNRTTERMISKRQGRLYIDYLQHGKGKTIIAPFSMRAVEEGTVASPVSWDQLKGSFKPESSTLDYVSERFTLPYRPVSDADTEKNTEILRVLISKLQKER
ncbi:DNA ligase D [Alteribacter natronophilus]|uniref:DNA ligase D n=1 Tax=Alteribacter natronophilus TaxID=2583810 RepID=UPI00110EA9EE|nr:DNA ligase D [Alteribacter natronophilus]TMW73491.1 DNA ligase D [Alteribacter natronophilus]